MNAAIQIAKHLSVSHWAITRTEEWAKVWFAVVRGLGARFVSKRVVKMEALHGYKRPYSELANALSALSGVSVTELLVKKEKKQENPFLPITVIYHVYGAESYSEQQVHEVWASAQPQRSFRTES